MKYRSVFLGLTLSLILYGAYFFNLLRNELKVILLRQEALESLKVLAVPGTAFLNDLGGLFILKSSLFYLALIGMLLVLSQLFSLCLKKTSHRVLFFGLLLAGLAILVRGDRIAFSFPFVTAVSFASFIFITLGVRIHSSWKDLLTLLIVGAVASASLFLGAREGFFTKTRDLLLFDSRLGDRVVSFYYTYSPLASALVSPARGVYGGLVFSEEIEDPFAHLGRGLVMTGDPGTRRGADFFVVPDGHDFFLENRYGDKTFLTHTHEAEIFRKTGDLFTMTGFRTLNRISLYAFPAALLLLPFFILRMVTRRRGPFLVMSVALGLGLVVLIGAITLTGYSRGPRVETIAGKSKGAALALAYDLYKRDDAPSEYLPALLELVQSDSTALRYWGARLLGYYPEDPGLEALLVELMGDPSPNVRCAAAISLFNMMREEAFEQLLSSLAMEKNWYVQCIIFSTFLRAGTIPHRM